MRLKMRMRLPESIGAATLACAAAASCGVPRSSIIDYAGLRGSYRAQFFADDDIVAVRAHNPSGAVLVMYPPSIEHGALVFNAGIASGGSGGETTRCFRVEVSALAPGWHERLLWRERDGRLAPIDGVSSGDEARTVIAACAAPVR